MVPSRCTHSWHFWAVICQSEIRLCGSKGRSTCSNPFFLCPRLMWFVKIPKRRALLWPLYQLQEVKRPACNKRLRLQQHTLWHGNDIKRLSLQHRRGFLCRAFRQTNGSMFVVLLSQLFFLIPPCSYLVLLMSFSVFIGVFLRIPWATWTTAQSPNYEFMLLSAKEKQFYGPTLKAQMAQGSVNIKGMDIFRYQPRETTEGKHLCVAGQH